MPRRRKRQKKSKLVQLLEFLPVYLAFQLVKLTPLTLGHRASRLLGSLFYYLAPRRRRIALENLRHAFTQTKSDAEIDTIARTSCYSLIASLFETAKLHVMLRDPCGRMRLDALREELDALFCKAKVVHEQSGGCIFVTPHIGNWEFLIFGSVSAGIPVVVVARPLDNQYLENWLYGYRHASGQDVVARMNSMYLLQTALRRGKSIAMVPDQSTMKAISVEYLGRPATTTPIPALLAVRNNRPIVVVACCRKSENFDYEGFVSDPIWPEPQQEEKAELFRLTKAINREMESIVRRYPEQYLWMHDRWKKYRSRGELFTAE
jgi:Kdo2-lipid IVA lauroyltransferase/acyltransferase